MAPWRGADRAEEPQGLAAQRGDLAVESLAWAAGLALISVMFGAGTGPGRVDSTFVTGVYGGAYHAAMAQLTLTVMSLRCSSWSMRAALTLLHAGADFEVQTETPNLSTRQGDDEAADAQRATASAWRNELSHRRALGSVNGFFPVLRVDGTPIHEALAINEWVAETYPAAGLYPADALKRAQARSLACEMAAGFPNIRATMSCHLAACVPDFKPTMETQLEIERVFELLEGPLQSGHGPFVFGSFGVVDAMYFPVITRLRTYGIPLSETLCRYAVALSELPAVVRLMELARQSPVLPVYDQYIRDMGGDPNAWPALVP